jgi:hypothetical protein
MKKWKKKNRAAVAPRSRSGPPLPLPAVEAEGSSLGPAASSQLATSPPHSPRRRPPHLHATGWDWVRVPPLRMGKKGVEHHWPTAVGREGGKEQPSRGAKHRRVGCQIGKKRRCHVWGRREGGAVAWAVEHGHGGGWGLELNGCGGKWDEMRWLAYICRVSLWAIGLNICSWASFNISGISVNRGEEPNWPGKIRLPGSRNRIMNRIFRFWFFWFRFRFFQFGSRFSVNSAQAELVVFTKA